MDNIVLMQEFDCAQAIFNDLQHLLFVQVGHVFLHEFFQICSKILHHDENWEFSFALSIFFISLMGEHVIDLRNELRALGPRIKLLHDWNLSEDLDHEIFISIEVGNTFNCYLFFGFVAVSLGNCTKRSLANNTNW